MHVLNQDIEVDCFVLLHTLTCVRRFAECIKIFETFLFAFWSYLQVQTELNAKQNDCDGFISNGYENILSCCLLLGVNLINRLLRSYLSK